MAKIISVNAGSSSLKFQLFEMDDESVITSVSLKELDLMMQFSQLNMMVIKM